MIFVDANVFMYAVGRPHPLKAEAHQFFVESKKTGVALATSAEVLQELLHVYGATGRVQSFDDVLELTRSMDVEVWPLDAEDVTLARQIQDLHSGLSARDSCHLASCQRRGVRDIMTFDKDFAAVARR